MRNRALSGYPLSNSKTIIKYCTLTEWGSYLAVAVDSRRTFAYAFADEGAVGSVVRPTDRVLSSCEASNSGDRKDVFVEHVEDRKMSC